jgi:hypothetical protein
MTAETSLTAAGGAEQLCKIVERAARGLERLTQRPSSPINK